MQTPPNHVVQRPSSYLRDPSGHVAQIWRLFPSGLVPRIPTHPLAIPPGTGGGEDHAGGAAQRVLPHLGAELTVPAELNAQHSQCLGEAGIRPAAPDLGHDRLGIGPGHRHAILPEQRVH